MSAKPKMKNPPTHPKTHVKVAAAAGGQLAGGQGEEVRTVHLTQATISRAAPHVYDVTIIRAGESENGYTYPAQVLEDSVDLFDGATAFVDHAGGDDFWRGTRSVRDVAGAYGNALWQDDDQAITAQLYLVDEPIADLLNAYINAKEAGEPAPNIGISADLTVTHRDDTITSIVKVHSADIVFGPAAGGQINQALEALRQLQEAMNMEPQETAVQLELEPEPETTEEPAAVAPEVPIEEATPATTPPDPLDLQEARRSIAQEVLTARLTLATDLPEAARSQLQRQFEGQPASIADIDQAFTAMRSLVAQLQPNPVQGHGSQRVEVTTDPLSRIQLAADRLFRVPDTPDNAPRLGGVRELYLTLTGDDDFTGQFNGEGVRISEANVTTSTFANIVKNALNKVLLAEYNTRYRWWEPIVWEEDFETLNEITWIKTATVENLATVSEGAAYAELDSDDTGETSTFVKKGGYIGITLEAIDRDDVAGLRRIPRELAYSAWRTLSALVSAIFTDQSGTGPDMADSKALFHADHSNLGTTALAIDAWETVIRAMYEQTDPKNSYTLALRPRFCVVPIELERTALEIFLSPNEPGTADNDINPYYGKGNVVTVPHWTDANNWAAVTDPNECPGICIGYRYGRLPELFVADQPEIGSMFTNDELRIKSRFFLAVGVADHRPLYKMNVA